MRPVPPLKTERDFDGLFDWYHTTEVPGDTVSYLSIARRADQFRTRPSHPKTEEVSLLLNGYLRAWGGMTRVYGRLRDSDDWDSARDRLERALADNWDRIHDLRYLEGWRDNLPVERLEVLFDRLLTQFRGTKSRRSSVGVAKLLHILLPGTCIIWDSE